MWAMIVKEFRELRRDPRTLAMLIVLPILFLVVFGFAANFTITSLSAVVFGPQASTAATRITSNTAASRHLEVVRTDPAGDAADARAALVNGEANVAVVTGGPKPLVYIDGADLFPAQSASVLVAGLGDKVDAEVLFNPDLKTSWIMVPALLGLILTFIGMIITSIGLVKERQNGTLEQLAVMPFRPSDVIGGKIVPYLLLASADMVAITLLGIWIFGVPFRGSPFLFAVGAGLFLFVVLGLGVLISTVSQTVGQAIQTAMFIMLPQILLSGFVFPLAAVPIGVRWIGYLLPLTYFAQIARGVMLRGASIGALWLPFLVLAVMAVVIFGAAVARFRRTITPARSRAGGEGAPRPGEREAGGAEA